MDGAASLTILHLLAPAPFGGLERVVQGLARGQKAAGQRVSVAAVAPDAEAAEGFLAPLEPSAVDARLLRVSTRSYLRERRLVRALCRELGPDIVHTHGYRPDVVDAGVARGLGIATVTTVHGFIGNTLRGRVYEWLQRRAFRRFDAVVAVARTQRASLTASGVPPERIHVVPNALDATNFESPEAAREAWGVARGTFHVGWVGRLSSEKGPDVLLDALSALEGEDLQVSMVGEGRLSGALRSRAAGTGVADRVRWHGRVPEAGALFRGFDLLVLSSRTEGTPMVLLEAMAGGVPVVATRVGGVPDVVSPAEAHLVEPDDPGALAAAIRDVREDRPAARRRARAARERFEARFSAEAWIGTYQEIYRGILGERSHG